jgi:vacuolar-type H+-ATPase subunit H
MSSRIEQIIGEIEEYVDSQPLSTTKIVVNKEEIEELLRELRLKTPDEIKRYQKIINNKDAILEDAQTKADALIADAQARAQELVTQHEIMQKAYAQANEVVMIATKQAQEILDNATNDANNIRMGAMQYTDDILKNLESTISHAMDSSKARSDAYMSTLQGFLDVVTTNRAELNPTADIQEETQTDTQELQQTMPEQQ